MKRSHRARRVVWFKLAKPSHRLSQLAEKSDALMSIIVEQRSQSGIFGRLRGFFVTALAIYERAD